MILPRNVSTFVDRHGIRRYRFRKAGLPQRYIHAEPGSREFDSIVRECHEGMLVLRPGQLTTPRAKTRKYPGGEVVYFIGTPRIVKIGTSADVRKRLYELRCASPQSLTLLATLPGSRQLERTLHRRFAHLKIRREWFRRTREIDALIDEILSTHTG